MERMGGSSVFPWPRSCDMDLAAVHLRRHGGANHICRLLLQGRCTQLVVQRMSWGKKEVRASIIGTLEVFILRIRITRM